MWTAAMDAVIPELELEHDVELWVRNGYDIYDDDPFVQIGFLNEYTLNENREHMAASLEIPLDNEAFQFNDEFDNTNKVQLAGECELRVTVFSSHLGGGQETQVVFRGLATDVEPSNYDLSVTFVDPLQKCEKATVDLNTEAEVVEDPFNPGQFYFEDTILKPLFPPLYDAFTYGVNEALQASAIGELGSRRGFQVRSMRVWVDEGAGYVQMRTEDYQVIYSLGLIKFFQLPNPLWTYKLDIVSFYIEATNCVEGIFESALLQNWGAAGPDFRADQLVIGMTGTITVINASVFIVGAGTLFLTELKVGERIRIEEPGGPPGDMTSWGIIETVVDNFNATFRYLWRSDSSVGSVTYEKSSLEHAYASVSKYVWHGYDGPVADLFRALRDDHTRRNYFIYYDPMDDKVRGKNVSVNTTPDFELFNAVRIDPPRSLEQIHTRILCVGEYERPQNLLYSASQITLLQTIPPWTQQTGLFNTYTYGGLGNLLDGNLYSCHAVYHTIPTVDEDTYYNTYKIDLGAVFEVGRVILHPIGPQNASQYSMTMTVEGSIDDSVYIELDPSTVGVEVKPGGAAIDFTDLMYGNVRYIKIKMKLCKWVQDGGRRHMGLAEIRIIGSEKVIGEAKIQDDVGGGRTVGGVFISHHYPNLMKKLSGVGVYRTYFDQNAPVYDDETAADRAYVLLNEFIRAAQEITFECPYDPRIKVFDTLRITDMFHPSAPKVVDIVADEIEHQGGLTTVTGNDYSTVLD